MERCTVISDRAELETFARQIPTNPTFVFSMGCISQKSCAEVSDFCDMFCRVLRRLPDIASDEFYRIEPMDRNSLCQYTVPFRRMARKGTDRAA